MYKIRYIAFVFILPFITTSTSCKKYLTEKSDKTLVEVKSISDLQGLLDDEYIMNNKTSSFGQVSDDDYFISLEAYNSLGIMDQQAYTWRLTNYRYPNSWADSYNAIYNANYCLDKIAEISKTSQNEQSRNNVEGSALFFRGFYSLYLLWEHAHAYDSLTAPSDLGIVLRLTSDFNSKSIRYSNKQCYDQVIADLRSAAEFLPVLPVSPNRPSKAAAYAVLARAFLSMRIYDSVYKYSDMSLSIKSDLLDYNSSEVDVNATVPFQRYNTETILYTTQIGNYTAIYSFYAYADSLLFSTYENNDLRKSAYFFDNTYGYSFKGSYAADMYVFFSGIATDEVLLMRAESAARIGNVVQALSDINTLLQSRYTAGTFVPFTNSNKGILIDFILQERRKELTMRGLRWMDIKRLNKEGKDITLKRLLGNQVFVITPNSNQFALPIPQDIVENYGIPQN